MVVLSYDKSINIGECVVTITCQLFILGKSYKTFRASLIAEGCKQISGSSISKT
ncbi:hypothetical protein FACS1894187_22760 [Synergistales bacterium]|nr:hypothetical protein FACS1894187_22760 [Synergistales bacterium]